MRVFHLATTALALGLVGCRAERHLIFVSEPPGAQVRIDGKLVGRTPLDLRFDSYGHRRVAILKNGFRSHGEIMEVEPPWFFYFPLDYLSEVFFPFGWEDIHRLEVVLEPHTGEVSRPDFDEVLRRAESLRRAGPAGPHILEPEPADKPPPAPGSSSNEN